MQLCRLFLKKFFGGGPPDPPFSFGLTTQTYLPLGLHMHTHIQVNCKQNAVIKRYLLNSSDVFTLGMIWNSTTPPVEDIAAVVNNIGQTLQLNEVSMQLHIVLVHFMYQKDWCSLLQKMHKENSMNWYNLFLYFTYIVLIITFQNLMHKLLLQHASVWIIWLNVASNLYDVTSYYNTTIA